MLRGLRAIAIAPCFNEERKIGEGVRRVLRDAVDEVLVVEDGSTDRSAEVVARRGTTVVSLGRALGVCAALRTG